tara:strand:+ start:644 stop:784 length:141 start_codon:yes stop_codon:yes gene_type:complete
MISKQELDSVLIEINTILSGIEKRIVELEERPSCKCTPPAKKINKK